jgi:hypothetical protein
VLLRLREDTFDYFDLNQRHEYLLGELGLSLVAKATVQTAALGPVGAPALAAAQKLHQLGNNDRQAAER